MTAPRPQLLDRFENDIVSAPKETLRCTKIEVIHLDEPEEIFPAYERALLRDDGRSTLLVEHGDYSNEK
ncbi:MAG: hypothetical protein WCJ31_04450 [Planctomycetia bacterium]